MDIKELEYNVKNLLFNHELSLRINKDIIYLCLYNHELIEFHLNTKTVVERPTVVEMKMSMNELGLSVDIIEIYRKLKKEKIYEELKSLIFSFNKGE